MGKTYRPYDPKQSYLLPPSPLDWLPTDHLARFILDTVEQLDLRAIEAHYEREHRGQPPYDPRMMVSLLLYAYCVGVPSSRKIEKKTYEDVAFRVLSGGQHPDHSRINEFRRIHLQALAGLFVQILRMCQKAGLVKLGHVALDGTKMKANASKHKAMSYERMQKEDQRLREKVDELLREAADVDAQEDELYGKDRRGDELPEELQDAEVRKQKIRQWMKELEEEAKQEQAERAAKKKDDDDDPPNLDLPEHRTRTEKDGKPHAKAQLNFTDSESRIMKSSVDGYLQGYNAQAVVDERSQVIVAQAVTNQAPDVEHYVPLMEQAIVNCEATPEKVSADAGYYSESNAVYSLNQGIDAYLSTRRTRHREPLPIVRGRPPKDMTVKQQMARKLATRRGAAVYARRKVIVEPVFGQIKEARGFRRFLLRGLAKVRAEWSLITMTHNLLKLHFAVAPAQ